MCLKVATAKDLLDGCTTFSWQLIKTVTLTVLQVPHRTPLVRKFRSS